MKEEEKVEAAPAAAPAPVPQEAPAAPAAAVSPSSEAPTTTEDATSPVQEVPSAADSLAQFITSNGMMESPVARERDYDRSAPKADAEEGRSEKRRERAVVSLVDSRDRQ